MKCLSTDLCRQQWTNICKAFKLEQTFLATTATNWVFGSSLSNESYQFNVWSTLIYPVLGSGLNRADAQLMMECLFRVRMASPYSYFFFHKSVFLAILCIKFVLIKHLYILFFPLKKNNIFFSSISVFLFFRKHFTLAAPSLLPQGFECFFSWLHKPQRFRRLVS